MPDETYVSCYGLETGCRLGLAEAEKLSTEPVWFHFDRRRDETQRWLLERSGVDALIAEAMLAEMTRCRAVTSTQGVLLILRGVNLNEGADPADMISLRIWAEPSRVISLQGLTLRTTASVISEFEEGRGPRSVGALLTGLASGLSERLADVVDEIGDALDEVEEKLVSGERVERSELVALRHRSIVLHRHAATQLKALNTLLAEGAGLLSEDDREVLAEEINRTMRVVEDLDSAKARGGVIHEEMSSIVGEQANRRIYAVTMITAIFLPLTLISGLLGMNVGGIPGQDTPVAFAMTVIGMALLGLLGVVVARRRGWL